MVQCEKCHQTHIGAYASGRFCSEKCARSFSGHYSLKKRNIIKCLYCNQEFLPKRSRTKFCCVSCARRFCPIEKQLKLSAAGSKGGRMHKVAKRSLNERLFADLCATKFEIICNEPMFDGWDADVILLKEKIAVLWNGVWHYKSIAGHSVKQVQKRDEIKISRIIEAGFMPYVIKDLGKHNLEFVSQEFDKFNYWIKSGRLAEMD